MRNFPHASSLFAVLLAILQVSCGPPTPEPENFTAPPVGVLDTGDSKVTLHSSPEGPLYTLENADGEMIARELTRSEFASQFPELKEKISSLWAGNERGEHQVDELARPVFQDLLELPVTD